MKNKHIWVTKISGDSGFEVGYYVKGFLTSDLKEGGQILVNRYERNGIEISGVFSSSPIKSIKDVEKIDGFVPFDKVIEVETENSTYLIREIK